MTRPPYLKWTMGTKHLQSQSVCNTNKWTGPCPLWGTDGWSMRVMFVLLSARKSMNNNEANWLLLSSFCGNVAGTQSQNCTCLLINGQWAWIDWCSFFPTPQNLCWWLEGDRWASPGPNPRLQLRQYCCSSSLNATSSAPSLLFYLAPCLHPSSPPCLALQAALHSTPVAEPSGPCC